MFEGKLVLLAEDESEPVGYAFGELDPQGYAHVNIVYVVPERRRQGVAKALLAAFGKRAREQGIEHLTLDVATRNEAGPGGLAAARFHRVGAAADRADRADRAPRRAR